MNKLLKFFIQKAIAAGEAGGLADTKFRPSALPSEENFFVYVANIINWVLGLVGLIAFIVLLYAGFNMLTSAGDPDKAKKSKEMIMYAIAGIILIMLSYSIASYFTAADSPLLG